MNRITGRSAFLALLKDEGITHLFGNPGTTELPIMHALKEHPDLTYVLGLQESLVVAMADGFSRASGKLVACNVHVAPGLGNAMGSLFNAKFTGTPMILTAGQQEQGHGLTEPLLYNPLVPMAEPLVKWAVEVTRLEDLPRIVHRAAKVAMTPPTGPVFISLPGDILNAEAGIDLGSATRVDTSVRPADAVLDKLAKRLLAAERPVIIVGDEMVKSDALEVAAAFAKTLGAPVYQQSVAYGAHFLSEHVCYMGGLSRDQKQVRGVLSKFDLVVALGADPVRMSVWSEVEPLPENMAVVHIGQVDWDMGKNFPAEIAVRADLRETLTALTPVLAKQGGERLASRAKAQLAKLEESNWSAKRVGLQSKIETRAKLTPIDNDWLTLQIANALPTGRGRRQREPDGRQAAERSRALPRPLRLPRSGLGRHRLGPAGVRRRGAGAGAAAGVLLLRRRQRHVLDPVAVDGGAHEAADHLRDRQQRRLPHHQAAPARLPWQQQLHRHGFRRSEDRLRRAGEVDGHARRDHRRAGCGGTCAAPRVLHAGPEAPRRHGRPAAVSLL